MSAASGAASPAASAGHDTATPADRESRVLPSANLLRVAKRALPPGAKVGKDAREALQESVSEFISFVTSEAAERCVTEKRKTINGEDILWAMSTLGFEEYVDPLQVFLEKYRAVCDCGLPSGHCILLAATRTRTLLLLHTPGY